MRGARDSYIYVELVGLTAPSLLGLIGRTRVPVEANMFHFSCFVLLMMMIVVMMLVV